MSSSDEMKKKKSRIVTTDSGGIFIPNIAQENKKLQTLLQEIDENHDGQIDQQEFVK